MLLYYYLWLGKNKENVFKQKLTFYLYLYYTNGLKLRL